MMTKIGPRPGKDPPQATQIKAAAKTRSHRKHERSCSVQAVYLYHNMSEVWKFNNHLSLFQIWDLLTKEAKSEKLSAPLLSFLISTSISAT